MPGRDKPGHRLPIQVVGAVGGRVQQPQDGEQRRFTAAGRPGDRQVLPFRDIDVDRRQRVRFHLIGHKNLAHLLQPNQRLRSVVHRHSPLLRKPRELSSNESGRNYRTATCPRESPGRRPSGHP